MELISYNAIKASSDLATEKVFILHLKVQNGLKELCHMTMLHKLQML